MPDLRGNSSPAKAPKSILGRIVGTVFVLAALSVAGGYVLQNWPKAPAKSVVADTRLPSTR